MASLFRVGERSNIPESKPKIRGVGEPLFSRDSGEIFILRDERDPEPKPIEVLKRVQTVHTDYTVSYDDDVIIVNSSEQTVNITLPSVFSGKSFVVKRIGNNEVTIIPPIGSTIDGSSSIIITDDHVSVTLITDGMNYYRI